MTTATTVEIDQLVDRVRESARSKLLRDSELLAFHHRSNDPTEQAEHELRAERLDPSTPDTAETTTAIEDEMVEMLRATAADHQDPDMQALARQALIRLKVPIEDAAAKKAAEVERERELWATRVWHLVNHSGQPLLKDEGDQAVMEKLVEIHGSKAAATQALEQARQQLRDFKVTRTPISLSALHTMPWPEDMPRPISNLDPRPPRSQADRTTLGTLRRDLDETEQHVGTSDQVTRVDSPTRQQLDEIVDSHAKPSNRVSGFNSPTSSVRQRPLAPGGFRRAIGEGADKSAINHPNNLQEDDSMTQLNKAFVHKAAPSPSLREVADETDAAWREVNRRPGGVTNPRVRGDLPDLMQFIGSRREVNIATLNRPRLQGLNGYSGDVELDEKTARIAERALDPSTSPLERKEYESYLRDFVAKNLKVAAVTKAVHDLDAAYANANADVAARLPGLLTKRSRIADAGMASLIRIHGSKAAAEAAIQRASLRIRRINAGRI